MRRGCLIAGFLVSITLGPQPSEAQYTANFQTNIISGVTSNWAGDYIVGSNTFADALLIRNSGVLSDTNGSGIVGNYSGGNSVLVTGTGSIWSNRDTLYVGLNASGNSLVISNGGRVNNRTAYIGLNFGTASPPSQGNSIVIAGTNSAWSSDGTLFLGTYGAGNSLTVKGGSVLVGSIIANGTLEVDGGTLVISNALGNASLTLGQVIQSRFILNGGTVSADGLILTNGAKSAITFPSGWLRSGNTRIANNSVFSVGDGTGGAVFALAGGRHSFADGLWIRTNAQLFGCGAVEGGVLVQGTVRIDCGGTSFFTGTVTNYGLIEVANGGYLVFPDSLVNYGQIVATNGAVRYLADFENNGTVSGDVQNGNNVWTSSTDGRWEDALNWSGGTPTNWQGCLITNSASKTVTIDSTTAGIYPASLAITKLTLAAPGGSTNVLWMNNSGTNSPLQIADSFTLGGGGKLVVSNAALEVSRLTAGSFTVDGEVSLSAAVLVVTNGTTSVSVNGTGQVTVSSSTVLTRETYLGQSTNQPGRLTVVGNGATWNGSDNLYIGSVVAGNSLTVTNGGRVLDAIGYIGYSSSSSNNSVLIADPGSVWSNRGILSVSSAGNNLVVRNGGRVFDTSSNVGSISNTLIVTDPGSVWTNTSGMSLGVFSSSSGNTLVISNGAKIASASCDLGGQTSVFVDGTGSVWSATSGFSLGMYYGGSNRVVVSNGARMIGGTYAGTGFGPAGKSIDGNVLVVTGPGSVLSNNSTIELAYHYGSGNSLIITNNGLVVDNTCYIGPDNYDVANSASSNNVRVVDGGVWRNNVVYVGNQGSDNSLVVNGGTVTVTGSITVGSSSGACDNYIELDGGGLFVTNSARTATLTIYHGKFILNGGLLQIDQLVMNTPCGLFVRNGGTVSVRTLVLNPALSAVGDGILNGWKQRYGLDPLDSNLANEDADGDGLSNLQEYLAGTDPTNSASSFRIISIVPSGIDLLVTWMMGSGRKNALQAMAGDASGYSTNSFTDIFIVTNTVGTTTNYLDTGAATNFPARYYLVRLVP